MISGAFNTAAIRTTSYKVVLPFYIYAAISFLVASILLLTSGDGFRVHYFHPHILAITHTMALGWATMIILGASHQLVPVMIEGKLYSEKLAYLSFALAATGIPLLVYGFYVFDMGAPAQWGARLVVLAVFSFLINMAASMWKSPNESIHGVFVFTASCWLFFTTTLGLILVYNFTIHLLPADSLRYLPLHAHAGIIGWFLLLVMGVASRLIPMFLISKYTNVRLLWAIYSFLNAALLLYLFIFFAGQPNSLYLIPVALVFAAITLFIYYCYQSYRQRLRKQVDEQMKISLLSVAMLLLPVVLLFVIIVLLLSGSGEKINIILTYGFLIFFGWLTAIILGMTFKTLPFIVWNKVYHHQAASGKTPSPKDLFNHPLFNTMCISYLLGLLLFISGIMTSRGMLLKSGAVLLIITAAIYNWNVIRMINHKAVLQ